MLLQLGICSPQGIQCYMKYIEDVKMSVPDSGLTPCHGMEIGVIEEHHDGPIGDKVVLKRYNDNKMLTKLSEEYKHYKRGLIPEAEYLHNFVFANLTTCAIQSKVKIRK